jgi:hypothetical protein
MLGDGRIPDQIISLEFGFREDGKGANTWLVVPNDEGVFYESEAKEGIRYVHVVHGLLGSERAS